MLGQEIGVMHLSLCNVKSHLAPSDSRLPSVSSLSQLQLDFNHSLRPLSSLRVRKSTLRRVQLLVKEEYRLSSLMSESLLRDRLEPILIQPHLLALDRRLGRVMDILQSCISKEGYDSVVEDDLGERPGGREEGHTTPRGR